MKERIAIVVQRYGLEVNGGSEYHSRLIAEMLANYFEVDVLTTKAIDYMTWEDHYKNDTEIINGVNVKRFSVEYPRNIAEFNKFSGKVLNNSSINIYDEIEWVKKQGPVNFRLLQYINENHSKYKKFIFFTYSYFTTFYGLQMVPEKGILVPTAHNEPHIYFSIYKSLFHLPTHIMYNTQEEKEFVNNLFHNEYIKSDIVGIGVDIPNQHLTATEFREKKNLKDPYLLYIGRIDESKGCVELFNFFLRYKKEVNNNIKLVLMGKSVMPIPKSKDIISLGFVSEEEKYGGLLGADCLIMPSKYESLSMVVLESLYMNTPVLVNAHCEVLKGHCERGNSGLYYSNYEEFKLALNFMLDNPKVRAKMGEFGHNYVVKNYSLEHILNSFIKVINTK